MSQHYVKKCKECDKVISQCRCPAIDKNVILDICEECKKIEKNKEENQ